MKFVILGAGLAGVTSAWELLRDGHEVTVIDRGAEVANFSSFANAGLVAPGHAFPWASPAAPGMMLRSLWRFLGNATAPESVSTARENFVCGIILRDNCRRLSKKRASFTNSKQKV